MPLLRLILLIGLAAGTLILAQSNWQPLPVVWLGLRSPALPIAVWIVAAVLMGALTTLVVNALLQLTSLATQRTERSRLSNSATQRSSRESAYTPAPPRTWQPPQPTRPAKSGDDWEQDGDDWFADEPSDRPNRRADSAPNLRSPDRTQPDPVVDADYRVIVPPQRNLEDDR